MPRMDFVNLETARLILRHFTDADLVPFMAYRNDPDVARYQGWEGISEAEAHAFIAEQKLVQPGVPGQWFQIAIALTCDRDYRLSDTPQLQLGTCV